MDLEVMEAALPMAAQAAQAAHVQQAAAMVVLVVVPVASGATRVPREQVVDTQEEQEPIATV